MKFLPKSILGSILILWLLLSVISVALGETSAETKVESVEVRLNMDGHIYEGLQERIEFSIGRVGEKILLSQPLLLLKQNEKTLRTAIFNVFSKVLVGFELESVDLFLGEHTRIFIKLEPQKPLISKVNLNIQFKPAGREFLEFSQPIIDKAETELNEIFMGLPVSSIVWTDGIINMVAQYVMEREFPGYKANLTIKPNDTNLDLYLKLIPENQVVKRVLVNYSSTTFPIWLVHSKLDSYQENFNFIKGIPVEFIIHYQTELEQFLEGYCSQFSDLKQWDLNTELSVVPGEKTQINLLVDSECIRTNLEGKLFVGETDYSFVQGYLGYRFDDYELYTKLFWGHYPGEKVLAGLQIPLSTNFNGGFEYELENHFKYVLFQYQFERGDYLKLKLGIDEAPNEALIGVRLNKHLNLELGEYGDDFGVQMMVHFW